MLKDLYEKNCLGKVIVYIYIIEFQKYDLSYSYILLILALKDKIQSITNYDSIISAKISDPTTHPFTYETIKNTIMYGPYDIMNPRASCMKDGMCQKHYSKSFQEII